MKKLITTSLILLSITFLNAQTFEWAKSMGGTDNDLGISITTDASGNIYTTGYFKNTVDFDPSLGVFNLISTGLNEIFIHKLNANGNFVWAKSVGGTNNDHGQSITTDASGNIYTTGYFQNTVDFDPGPSVFNLTSNGNEDFFILKLDSSGNFEWAKSMGGINDDRGYSITADINGNIYTTGYFQNTVDFDPGSGLSNITTNGSLDIFIQKLDASGNFIWAKSMGSSYTNDDRGASITTDASGNVYTTGFFYNTVDFDPGSGVSNLTNNGYSDIFIQKLDSSGNFVWAKAMGGTNNDRGHSINTDASGNVYTTGYFRETVDFDPGTGVFNLTSNGSLDIFIQKLNSSGNFVWALAMGHSSADYGQSITTDASGNVYTTGVFNGTIDFDPGSGVFILSTGSQEIFIQKLDSSGNFVWAGSMGGIENDYGYSIITDASGNIYTTGYFQNTVDFDPGSGISNLTTNGYSDIFIQKLSQCSNNSSIDTQTACNSYTWIDNNTYTSSNNTATYTLTNVEGCDSVVTLDLTVNNSNTGTDTQTACNSYTWIDSIAYTSSNNIATHTLTNVEGCDSVVTLDLTINPLPNTTAFSTTDTTCLNNNDGVALSGSPSGGTFTGNGVSGVRFYPQNSGIGSFDIIYSYTDTNGCTGTDTITIVVMECSSLLEQLNISTTLYPNPTGGNFTIEIKGYNGPFKVEIYDLQGRLLETTNKTTVSIKKYSKGIYVFRVSYGDIVEEIKVVKE